MAGIERLEVHSKSYVVRWVKVQEDDTLSWSVQPHKKSINFGIVKHPGSGATTLVASTDDIEASSHSADSNEQQKGSSRFPKKETTAQDLLKNKGFIPIKWLGKCEADKVSLGTYDVHTGQGGMYGLVFDNTFSKQTSKTATFVVLTYPTGAPPQVTNHLPNLQLPNAEKSESSLAKHASPRLDARASDSVDSFHSHAALSARSDAGVIPANTHTGNLSKRRRKKGQGYARRFFSLDYSTCTLSYYYNRNSSALRGAIPLSLAAISADERRREISIDSGAEVWHLRAPNPKEFHDWAKALEKASRLARGLDSAPRAIRPGLKLDTGNLRKANQSNAEEDAEWHQVETLVSRVVGTRDALRRLTKELSAVPKPSNKENMNFLSPASATPSDDGGDGYFNPAAERRPFWRRKSSAQVSSQTATQQAATSALAASTPGTTMLPPPSTKMKPAKSTRHSKRKSRGENGAETSIPDHCGALLADLDSVVAEFSTLILKSKRRRMPNAMSAGASRRSIDSVSTTEEFFDAEDATSGVVRIADSEDESPEGDADEEDIHDSSSISSVDADDIVGSDNVKQFFPKKSKTLAPLPINKVIKRRTTIPEATVLPPSLIAFVRKNVGKDLSTISMPVSANEPLSLLQKVAEQLEYAQLLDEATTHKTPDDRLLYVTAFAISQFSSGRAKERAIRKPFNPLLGETYELVRTDKEVPGGFRLLVEKVQHRPVKLAMQADAANWSFNQSPAPGQKFWGKSAEITTDGRVRVTLHLPGGEDEFYSWNIATMFLRNVVMGEKYVEPVGTMNVVNDSTGHKAAVEFKSKGMFGGRSEDVQCEIFGPDGKHTANGLSGNWTSSLKHGGRGKFMGEEIWHAGSLVDNAAQVYGMTLFAAGLNEITEIEKDKLPATDCRLRPDQRLAEEGNLDDAETWKVKLEEAQRARRRQTEERGEVHKARWFTMSEHSPEGEEIWKLKTGKEGYWDERGKGAWTGVEEIFTAN